MVTRYRIELEQTTKGFVTVEAEDVQQARELALAGFGKNGDSILQPKKIITVQPLGGRL